MGISGHMLGERRLRRLREQTGIPFDRAYIMDGRTGEGVVWSEGSCTHYAIDPKTKTAVVIIPRAHWSSCPG